MRDVERSATGRLHPGTLLAGRWSVGEVLGRGRHAVVYRATHATQRYEVALKVLEPDPACSDEERTLARTCFERESRLHRRVRHPNVVQVHEAGVGDDGTAFLALEMVEGECLHHRLERELLTVPQAIDLGLQLLGALGALEALGIVHRDLRPGNVMLGRSALAGADVKLCDLGLACTSADAAGEDHEHVLGSPRYLAPEQVRSFGVDIRADLFSLGVVLYESLVGRPPARGSRTDEILASVLSDEPEPIHDTRADCPIAFDGVLRRALAKRPEDRYATAQQMQDAMREMARALRAPVGPSAWAVPGPARRRRTASVRSPAA